jgi:hypothetical protein
LIQKDRKLVGIKLRSVTVIVSCWCPRKHSMQRCHHVLQSFSVPPHAWLCTAYLSCYWRWYDYSTVSRFQLCNFIIGMLQCFLLFLCWSTDVADYKIQVQCLKAHVWKHLLCTISSHNSQLKWAKFCCMENSTCFKLFFFFFLSALHH